MVERSERIPITLLMVRRVTHSHEASLRVVQSTSLLRSNSIVSLVARAAQSRLAGLRRSGAEYRLHKGGPEDVPSLEAPLGVAVHVGGCLAYGDPVMTVLPVLDCRLVNEWIEHCHREHRRAVLGLSAVYLATGTDHILRLLYKAESGSVIAERYARHSMRVGSEAAERLVNSASGHSELRDWGLRVCWRPLCLLGTPLPASHNPLVFFQPVRSP